MSGRTTRKIARGMGGIVAPLIAEMELDGNVAKMGTPVIGILNRRLSSRA
jgi:hypothetical protein